MPKAATRASKSRRATPHLDGKSGSARAPHGPHAKLLAELNRNRAPNAHVRFDASIPWGPSMRIERFVLGNGLRVLILEDHVAPVACLQLWFGVGSRHERAGKTGIAHLFEHLMFGETDDVPHGAYDRMLSEAGADTNAATFLDWTYYHTNLPKDALALAMRLEAGRIAKLVLRDPQVTSEKEVVANERRQTVEDDVDGSVSELLYKEAFRTHGYGWPIIGWMDDIQGFTTEDCVAFYRTYYAPNNARLVVVGDASVAEVLRLAQEHFGPLAPSVIPVEDVKPEPPQVAERRVQTSKPTPTHKVAIGYRGPAFGDVDHAPLVLLNEILFSGRSSRAHRRLIQELEIAIDVRGDVGATRDPGLYDVSASARGEHTTEEILRELDAVLDAVRREPVTEAELDRAKARAELSTLQGLETASGKAEQVGFYETVLGDPAALFDKLEQYRRASRSDLLRVARRYLDITARTVVEVSPDGTDAEAGDDEDADADDGDDGEQEAA